jgi:hypothetical protein
MEKSSPDLKGLVRAGSKHVQPSSKPDAKSNDTPINDGEIDFSRLGGKSVQTFEAPVSPPDGKPIDFCSVYGEHGGQVLAPPNAESHDGEDNA